ncbi:hypothetical protein TNCV_4181751 [Trichonephila clavipes]|nr:hypothetical protein TNCV_4181751 [Trichonephila clavipes]
MSNGYDPDPIKTEFFSEMASKPTFGIQMTVFRKSSANDFSRFLMASQLPKEMNRLSSDNVKLGDTDNCHIWLL